MLAPLVHRQFVHEPPNGSRHNTGGIGRFKHGIAFGSIIEYDSVQPEIGLGVLRRVNEAKAVFYTELPVAVCYFCLDLKHLRKGFHLRDTKRGVEIGQTIVETNLIVEKLVRMRSLCRCRQMLGSIWRHGKATTALIDQVGQPARIVV